MMRIVLLFAYPLGMALGQAMFKLAAQEAHRLDAASWAKLVFALSFNLWFIAALLLYAALSIIWVQILIDTPLSIAYPFVALAFVLTPLLGHFAFGEALSWGHAAGLALVVVGLLLVLKQ